MSHVTHMNESCHTYEWVMSHICMSHVTHMNESCQVYKWVTSYMNESCHTYEWDMSHIWLSHVTHMNESCPTYVTSHLSIRRFLVRGKAVMALIRMDMSHMKWVLSHVWMSPEWVMSHIRMSHVTHKNETCHTCERVTSRMNESCHT